MPSAFFCGIGGSGMSALAQILCLRGWEVSGSDRGHDRGEAAEKFQKLQAAGIKLYPQDGSGVHEGLDMLVVSTAVEETVPDVKAARGKKILIKHRAELLAELFHEAQLGIAVAGTSGKSTVTAMIGWILHHSGRQPTIINGARMVNFETAENMGNTAAGGRDVFVIETDESDASLSRFTPSIGVVTNITLDHKALPELRILFSDFIGRARQVILNLDDPETAALADKTKNKTTFAIHCPADYHATDIVQRSTGSSFTLVQNSTGMAMPVQLNVPGEHNISNALAACAAAHLGGVSLADAAAALAGYRGLRRRFEVMGTAGGVTVIDDFAHNPDKIAATLSTLHQEPGRVIAVYQPHGYGPTRLLKNELIKTFIQNLSSDDILLMPEIYYAGGAAVRDISSRDITDAVAAGGKQAFFIEKRESIVDYLKKEADSGDRVVIMGARDDTLSDFARQILSAAGEDKRRTA